VNLRTADFERMARFYVEVLGLRLGDRPPFGFPGALALMPASGRVFRSGAGSIPASAKMLATVERPTSIFRPFPW
jgi:catechol 2,3-dioxygenase-like lactoylglutathione lyase family enzyme